MIFGTLINNNGTLRKCHLFFFFCGYKSLEISAYNENRIFKKKVNNFEIDPTTDFSLTSANKPQRVLGSNFIGTSSATF